MCTHTYMRVTYMHTHVYACMYVCETIPIRSVRGTMSMYANDTTLPDETVREPSLVAVIAVVVLSVARKTPIETYLSVTVCA